MTEEKKDKSFNSKRFLDSNKFMFRLAVRNQKSVIIVMFTLIACQFFSTVLQTFISPRMLQLIEEQASLTKLIGNTLLFLFLLMILESGRSYLSQTSMYAKIDLRTRIISASHKKICSTSYSNLLQKEFQDTYAQVGISTSSNAAATEAFWNQFQELLTHFLSVLFYILVLSKMPIYLIVLVIFTSVLSYFFHKRAQDWAYEKRQEGKAVRHQVTYVQEVSSSIDFAKDIRIFGLKDWLLDIKERSMQLRFDYEGKIEKKNLLADVLQILLAFLRNAIAYYYLIQLALHNEISVAFFVLYFSSFTNLSSMTEQLLGSVTTMVKTTDELHEVIDFLNWEEPFLFEESAPRIEFDKDEPVEIRFDHVSFRYPEAEEDTVIDLNFTFYPGEKLAIVGLNGAGKTTLVRLLCGFLDPTEGSVLINGKDLRLFNRESYYQLFSAVFQDFTLLAGSVKENICQSTECDLEKLEEVIEISGFTRILEKLENGLDTRLKRDIYPDAVDLSGGELQTLMLARCLYKDAPLFVLDEPTAALDPIAESEMYTRYHELSEGRSTLFISHRLASTRFCDRIFMMEEGKIIEVGSHEELIAKKGRYRELFEIQSQYYKEGSK